MPQMAPIMWLPLFALIIFLMLLVESAIYFTSNKTSISLTPPTAHFTTTWLW